MKIRLLTLIKICVDTTEWVAQKAFGLVCCGTLWAAHPLSILAIFNCKSLIINYLRIKIVAVVGYDLHNRHRF
jgi:hypothetical protein